MTNLTSKSDIKKSDIKNLTFQNLTLKDTKDEIISLVSSSKEQELDFFVINIFIMNKIDDICYLNVI